MLVQYFQHCIAILLTGIQRLQENYSVLQKTPQPLPQSSLKKQKLSTGIKERSWHGPVKPQNVKLHVRYAHSENVQV